ncbi:hypothetical protein GPECTOR_16g694 [Gonium pectorale]|uniref:MIB/HERC2 domain-containing protein n=1 Tax=Gonium pectorale TaxID=33097 RepID=A0A150GKZ3_GONPE|nr:hypothetical protein GPECTOR_16g694 [Gonium pectorale]|eukprot:KXZ50519.1 hypothetical protein GPECTOR_16g694 [Gonium pectorale]
MSLLAAKVENVEELNRLLDTKLQNAEHYKWVMTGRFHEVALQKQSLDVKLSWAEEKSRLLAAKVEEAEEQNELLETERQELEEQLAVTRATGMVAVTAEIACPGLVVVRGPDWDRGNEDGGPGKTGRLVRPSKQGGRWVVRWDHTGRECGCRVGKDGEYDLWVASASSQRQEQPAAAAVAPATVTEDNARVGLVVVRGPDWDRPDEDGGAGKTGRIIRLSKAGLWVARWAATGVERGYKTGQGGRHELRLTSGLADRLLDSLGPRLEAAVEAVALRTFASNELLAAAIRAELAAQEQQREQQQRREKEHAEVMCKQLEMSLLVAKCQEAEEQNRALATRCQEAEERNRLLATKCQDADAQYLLLTARCQGMEDENRRLITKCQEAEEQLNLEREAAMLVPEPDSPPLLVTADNARPGLVVVRGPDWLLLDEDGGPGKTGVLVRPAARKGRWVVRWAHSGKEIGYSVGKDGIHELQVAPAEEFAKLPSAQRQPGIVTEDNARVGLVVVRGPDWDRGNEDGGPGHIGWLVRPSKQGRWVVRWHHSGRESGGYRVGKDGKYDLQL